MKQPLALPALALLVLGSAARAAAPATDVDRIFVSKVSQGGLYEVKASELAEKRASSPAVRDIARIEVKDHKGVNGRLMNIALDTQVTIQPKLNGEFQARLDRLKGASAGEFDAAYIADMREIHDKDEKLFADEAQFGSSAYTGFAGSADAIVKSHITSLAAIQTP